MLSYAPLILGICSRRPKNGKERAWEGITELGVEKFPKFLDSALAATVINQSINQSISQSINQSMLLFQAKRPIKQEDTHTEINTKVEK